MCNNFLFFLAVNDSAKKRLFDLRSWVIVMTMQDSVRQLLQVIITKHYFFIFSCWLKPSTLLFFLPFLDSPGQIHSS